MILSKNLLHNLYTFSPLFIVSVFGTQFTCMYFLGIPLIPTACISMLVCFLILNILYLITEFQKDSHTALANNTARIRTQTQTHREINPSRENSVVARIEENREIYQSRENIVDTRIEEIYTEFTGRLGRNLLSYGFDSEYIQRGISLGNAHHARLSSATYYNNDNARRSIEAFLQSLEVRQPFQVRQAMDDHRTYTLPGNPDDHLRIRLSQLRQVSEHTSTTNLADENQVSAPEYTSTTSLVDENQSRAHEELIKTINDSYPEIHDKLCSPDLNLVCPLTHELIIDPVKADDGFTYEKAQIAQWLNNNSTSPMTRVRISLTLSQDSDYKRKLQQAFHKEQNEQVHQYK